MLICRRLLRNSIKQELLMKLWVWLFKWRTSTQLAQQLCLLYPQCEQVHHIRSPHCLTPTGELQRMFTYSQCLWGPPAVDGQSEVKVYHHYHLLVIVSYHSSARDYPRALSSKALGLFPPKLLCQPVFFRRCGLFIAIHWHQRPRMQR